MKTHIPCLRIAEEVRALLEKVPLLDYQCFVDALRTDATLFFDGYGRSGLVAKAAAMRFMHLGYQAYAVGESTTPAIMAQDVLLILSASGKTEGLCRHAAVARGAGAHVLLLTAVPQTELTRRAERVLFLPAPSFKNVQMGKGRSCQLPGSLFEQAALILLDGMVMDLIEQNELSHSLVLERHANLE